MSAPDFALEQAHAGIVCGIDEAGRGPLAGPVVAAAVIFPQYHAPAGINDSKKLSAAARERLLEAIQAGAHVGIGTASVQEIDTLNILGATKLAMQRAYALLPLRADAALIDGNQPPALPCRVQAVIKGDALSLSIAAASIVAKVTRDRIMQQLGAQYPGYGFERHAGYGTKAHLGALMRLGVTPHHRASFAPIREILQMAEKQIA